MFDFYGQALLNVFLKHYFRRVCLQKPKGFSFNKAFFDACWVAAVVVWAVLKRFSRFVMCAHVENPFFLESLSLLDCCIKECCF